MGNSTSISEGQKFPMHRGRPTKAKSTNDATCVFFICYVAMMAGLVALGFYYGKPGRLSHGVNYAGQVCGIDGDVASKPFAYWCGITDNWNGVFPPALNDDSIVCLESCPTDSSTAVDCLLPAIKNFTGEPASVQEYLPDGNKNVETLYMQVAQTVAKQKSYPTEPFAGKFCLPSEDDMPLRQSLIKGPWAAKFRFYAMISSVQSTGLVVLISCVLALLLGFFYLYLLKQCAGPVMFGTMVFSTLCCVVVGICFVWAIFVGDDWGTSFYCKSNPFYRTYSMTEARLYSVALGCGMLLFGCCLGCMTARSITHIDEMIGIVQATCDCLTDTAYFKLWPIWQTVIYFAFWVLFLFIGLPYVASYGILDTNQIVINENSYQGLEARFHREDWQWWLIGLYLFGVIWCIEVYVQFGHYVVSYCVACWYFTPVKKDEKAVDYKAKMEKQIKKYQEDSGGFIDKNRSKFMPNVRVAGADANYGARPAYQVTTDQGQFIMVNVQKKGPGLGRNDVELQKMVKAMDEAPAAYPIADACWDCLTNRIGSLAIGAFPIFFFRPFRIFADCVSAQLSRQGENPLTGPLTSAGIPEARSLEYVGCCKIFTQFLDQAVGKYNKMAYMQQVLEGGNSEVEEHHHGAKDPDLCCCPKFCFQFGSHDHEHGHGDEEHEHHHAKDGFFAAADRAFEQIVKAGGSLSYLHGSLFIYEAFGTLAITLFCSCVSLILLNCIPLFNSDDSEYFVEDKMTATFVAGMSAGCVGFSCMSTFNHSADCILYCVGWNRLQQSFIAKRGNQKAIQAFALRNFCPQSLIYLVPAYEMDPGYMEPLPTTAQGTRQIDALFAAMQSGVQSMRTGAPMQYGSQYGPDYSQAPSTGMIEHMGTAFGDHVAGMASGRY